MSFGPKIVAAGRMRLLTDYLEAYGYWVLVGAVFAEQVGVPLPATPVLLGMGALAAVGKLSLFWAVVTAILACVSADSVWFWLGRRKGRAVLRQICRISLEPERCMTSANAWFVRVGDPTVVAAKFVPALSPVAAAIAGTEGMTLRRFLLLDLLGATAWTGGFLGLGYVFHDQVEEVVEWVRRLGKWGLLVGGVFLGGLGVVRWRTRQGVLRRMREARISPEALWQRLEAGGRVTVLDLRDAEELAAGRAKIPGAVHFPMVELERRQRMLPRDGEIVLYCSCPEERTSVAVALALERHGVRRIQLLAGGYGGWRERGLRVEEL
jgi:membrane protein DedA with SNARE-associated domain/rhodanese-related sulfurtransferase